MTIILKKKQKGMHSGEEPHECKICDKSFYIEERPFSCNICCMAFSSKSDQMDHISTHTEETPYQCNICDKGFLNNNIY